MWLCNMAPGAIRDVTGGVDRGALWMDHVLDDLRTHELTIRVLYASAETADGELDKQVSFASFAEKEAHFYTSELESVFSQELKIYQPDIIHIWGTEYGHTLAMVNAADMLGYLDRVVVSIQGLCSVIAKHYCEGIPIKVQRSNTFRDFIKRNSLRAQQNKFKMRGEMEVRALQKVRHIIGRTDWDKACTTQINPRVQYHYCNETLRKEFYIGEWDYATCDKHSIFCSSGEYPVKGLHYVLEALHIVSKVYPDVKLKVSGANPFPKKDLLEKLRYGVYAKHLQNLVSKYGLQDKLEFTGFLGAERIREEYLKANVFVSASTIENSPNSLGEAMMLGVPCVASDVGGVANLISHKKEGFVYQSTAPYMLAYYIMEVFNMQDDAMPLGKVARKKAALTHSPEVNCRRLMEIYGEIYEPVTNG